MNATGDGLGRRSNGRGGLFTSAPALSQRVIFGPVFLGRSGAETRTAPLRLQRDQPPGKERERNKARIQQTTLMVASRSRTGKMRRDGARKTDSRI